MLFLIVGILRLLLQTVIGTSIAARAWAYRPAKLFVFLTGSLIFISTIAHLNDTIDPAVASSAAYGLAAAYDVGQVGLLMSFLLLASSLCLPQWWQGDRPPIRWVLLPYALVGLAVLLDCVTPLDLLLGAPVMGDLGYVLAPTQLGRTLLVGLYVVGWLVVAGVLIAGYAQRPKLRPVIVIIPVSLVISFVLGQGFKGLGFGQIGPYIELFQTIPTLLALAYAVLRGQRFEAKRVALDLALEAMGEAVAVMDRQGEVLYANPQAKMLGLSLGAGFSAGLAQAGIAAEDISKLSNLVANPGPTTSHLLALGTPIQLIAVSLATVVDADQQAQGTLLLGRDVTEVEQRTALLARERTRLADTVSELQAEQQQRTDLAATVQALSLPLIPVLDGVLVLPVIGSFDAQRTSEFLVTLLGGIERERARLVLVDVTGMTLLDPAGAQGLMRGVRAAGLLGARCVLVGVRPELAQSLVGLNMTLANLQTAATLQQALRQELRA